MKKLLVALPLFVLLFASCGRNSGEIRVDNPQIIEKDSDLKDWFKIVNGTYQLERSTVGTSDGSKISIGFELAFKKTKESDGYSLEFGDLYLIPKDVNNNTLKDDIGDAIRIKGYNVDDLMYLKNGERKRLSFSYDDFEDKKYILDDILKNMNHFDIYCKTTKKEEERVDSEVLLTDNPTSDNWDKLLDSYEKYLDQYVKLYKKAQTGDMSALTEYTSMLEKAESLSKQLEKAKGDLSAKQMNRFIKLQTKLTEGITQ